jgi:hypothetical protein
MQSAARRRYIVQLGAWLILALALLPNISYMGHWPEMASAAPHTELPIQPLEPGALDRPLNDINEHAMHCHLGPAHCGGGEGMVGTPFVGDDTGVLVLTVQETEVDHSPSIAAINGHPQSLLQPPRVV